MVVVLDLPSQTHDKEASQRSGRLIRWLVHERIAQVCRHRALGIKQRGGYDEFPGRWTRLSVPEAWSNVHIAVISNCVPPIGAATTRSPRRRAASGSVTYSS